jgi:hypothetical protein
MILGTPYSVLDWSYSVLLDADVLKFGKLATDGGLGKLCDWHHANSELETGAGRRKGMLLVS